MLVYQRVSYGWQTWSNIEIRLQQSPPGMICGLHMQIFEKKKRPLVLRFAPHVTFRYSARHFSMVKYRGNDPHKTWPEMIADSYHFSYVLRPWAYMDEAWRLFGRSQWHCHDWVNFWSWKVLVNLGDLIIWLFNSLPWKDPPFLIGKPSIFMGHLYHGYVSHNQMVVI